MALNGFFLIRDHNRSHIKQENTSEIKYLMSFQISFIFGDCLLVIFEGPHFRIPIPGFSSSPWHPFSSFDTGASGTLLEEHFPTIKRHIAPKIILRWLVAWHLERLQGSCLPISTAVLAQEQLITISSGPQCGHQRVEAPLIVSTSWF